MTESEWTMEMGDKMLDAIRRNYLPEMLSARTDHRRNCACQRGGVDAVSIDGDWLHAAGDAFTSTVAELERMRAERDLMRYAARVLHAEVGRQQAKNATVTKDALLATEDHPTTDCPGCQYALQPMDATGAGRTWPVVNMPGLDPWLRHIEADDTPEPVGRPWLARGDNHPANGTREDGHE